MTTETEHYGEVHCEECDTILGYSPVKPPKPVFCSKCKVVLPEGTVLTNIRVTDKRGEAEEFGKVTNNLDIEFDPTDILHNNEGEGLHIKFATDFGEWVTVEYFADYVPSMGVK